MIASQGVALHVLPWAIAFHAFSVKKSAVYLVEASNNFVRPRDLRGIPGPDAKKRLHTGGTRRV